MTRRILAVTSILFAVQLMPCLIGNFSFLMQDRAEPKHGVVIRGKLVLEEGTRFEVINGRLEKSGSWSYSYTGDACFFVQFGLGMGLCFFSILTALMLWTKPETPEGKSKMVLSSDFKVKLMAFTTLFFISLVATIVIISLTTASGSRSQ